jgi:hypothetical protein
MELGLKILSAARHNDEFEGVLAVVAELPFVLLRLLAVAMRLGVCGIVVRKGSKPAKIEIFRLKQFFG